MSFKKYADIFGFDKIPKKQPNQRFYTTRAIDPVNTENIMIELSNKLVNNYHGNQIFENEVRWGTNPGAIRVTISPLGSYRANIQRLITDLNGRNLWITKEVLPLFNLKYLESENKMTEDISNILDFIQAENLDAPKNDYENIEKLVIKLTNKLRNNHPDIFIYEGVKKLAENDYIIRFGLSGYGLEAPTASRVETFLLHVNYKPEKGYIRIFGNDIQSPIKGHTWIPQPSEFDEYFMPTQSSEDICRSIVNILSTY